MHPILMNGVWVIELLVNANNKEYQQNFCVAKSAAV